MTRHARLRFGLMSSLLSAGLILVQPAAVGAAGASVTINNYQFTPRSIAVLPGTTITWTNRQADDNHTVTSDTGVFDSGAIKKADGTFSLTFSTAGTFAYHCTLHSTMHGTVVVSANAQEPPPTDTIGEGRAAPTPALPTPIALAIVGAAAVLGAGLAIRWHGPRR
jgi:plastocyanin